MNPQRFQSALPFVFFAAFTIASFAGIAAGQGFSSGIFNSTANNGTCYTVLANQTGAAPSTVNCGNGVIDENVCETCDDKNSNSGDGCSKSCNIEYGYQCNNTAYGSLCSCAPEFFPVTTDKYPYTFPYCSNYCNNNATCLGNGVCTKAGLCKCNRGFGSNNCSVPFTSLATASMNINGSIGGTLELTGAYAGKAKLFIPPGVLSGPVYVDVKPIDAYPVALNPTDGAEPVSQVFSFGPSQVFPAGTGVQITLKYNGTLVPKGKIVGGIYYFDEDIGVWVKASAEGKEDQTFTDEYIITWVSHFTDFAVVAVFPTPGKPFNIPAGNSDYPATIAMALGIALPIAFVAFIGIVSFMVYQNNKQRRQQRVAAPVVFQQPHFSQVNAPTMYDQRPYGWGSAQV